MADTSVLLSGIEYKLRKLVSEHEMLKKKVDAQAMEIKQLRHENDIAINKISILTEKLEIKTVAESFSNKTEIEEGRKRIQALMRNIEQSIALINK